MQDAYLKLALVAIALLGNCVLAIFILGRKLSSVNFVQEISSARAPVVAVPLWTGVILVASILLTVWTHHKLFYLLFALTPVMTLSLCRVAAFPFWNIRLKNILNYALVGLWVLFLILIPLFLITFFSAIIFKKLGLGSMQPPIQMLLETKDISALAAFLVFAVVIAPMLEEMGFRGFLYPMLKGKMGRWWASIVVSLVFALAHMHAPTFIPLFCLGMVLVSLYEITGSLGHCIALHVLFNATNCLLIVVARPLLNP